MSVSRALYQYCQQVADDLDNQKGLVSKYFKIPSIIPEANKIDHTADRSARKTFLEQEFEPFYEKVMAVFIKLNDADIASIGMENAEVKETENAKELLACVDWLNKAGFYHVNGKPVACWSGRPEGKERADSDPDTLSNGAVPACVIFCELGELLKEKERDLSNKIFRACSALFVRDTAFVIKVFSSASTAEEMLPRVTANNFNALNELPIAQNQRRRGKVTHILFFHYLHAIKQWRAPIDMNKEAYDLSARRLSGSNGHLLTPSSLRERALSEEEKRAGERIWNKKGSIRPAVSSEFLRFLFRARELQEERKDHLTTRLAGKSIALGLKFCLFYFNARRSEEKLQLNARKDFQKIKTRADEISQKIKNEAEEASGKIKAEADSAFEEVKNSMRKPKN